MPVTNHWRSWPQGFTVWGDAIAVQWSVTIAYNGRRFSSSLQQSPNMDSKSGCWGQNSYMAAGLLPCLRHAFLLFSTVHYVPGREAITMPLSSAIHSMQSSSKFLGPVALFIHVIFLAYMPHTLSTWLYSFFCLIHTMRFKLIKNKEINYTQKLEIEYGVISFKFNRIVHM